VLVTAEGKKARDLAWFTLPHLCTIDFDEPGMPPQAYDGTPWLRITASSPDQFCLSENGEGNIQGTFGAVSAALMERATYHLADQSRGGAVLHGALVARHGQALALLGSSGAGKSTLAAWLAIQGLTGLTDELIHIPSGGLIANGLARPVFLKGKSAQLIPTKDNIRSVPVERLPNRPEGWLFPLYPGQQQDILLKGALFPCYRPGNVTEIKALSGAGTAVELAKLLVNARNLPQNGFPEVLRLGRELPAYSITYGNFDQKLTDFVLSLL